MQKVVGSNPISRSLLARAGPRAVAQLAARVLAGRLDHSEVQRPGLRLVARRVRARDHEAVTAHLEGLAADAARELDAVLALLARAGERPGALEARALALLAVLARG